MSENTTVAVKSIEELKADVERLTADLTESKRLADYRSERITYLNNQLVTAGNDWNILNGFLNEYANEESMCSSYEDRISRWNNDFRVFSLEGRMKEYEVSVTVTATYYATVTVEAQSYDGAQEQVDDMDTDEIMTSSGTSWSYPDESEFTVTDVS